MELKQQTFMLQLICYYKSDIGVLSIIQQEFYMRVELDNCSAEKWSRVLNVLELISEIVISLYLLKYLFKSRVPTET